MFRKDAECQCLSLADRIGSALAVLHDAGQTDPFGDLASVVLLLSLNRELHCVRY